MNASAVIHEFRGAAGRAEKLLDELQGRGQASVHRLSTSALKSAKTAQRRLRSAESQLRDTVLDAARSADGYVREKPWQVIAGGFLLGVLIGALVARRRPQTADTTQNSDARGDTDVPESQTA
jgi:ElaB/YqjD/DUF883 family membrane-anchored ribosome-binding protein